MPESDPTPWELQRTLAAIRQDMRDGFEGLNRRLDKVVPIEVFATYQGFVDRRLTTMEADIEANHRALLEQRKTDDDRRATDRRLILTALVAPALLILLQLYLTSRGSPT